LVEYLLRSFTKFLEMEAFFRSRSFSGGPVWQKKLGDRANFVERSSPKQPLTRSSFTACVCKASQSLTNNIS
jgi:hypothetical protein